jgi:hypothetical protein
MKSMVEPLPCLRVGENGGFVAAHPARVALHDFERRTHVERQVDLNEQVGFRRICMMPGPPLRGIFSPAITSVT